MKSRILISWCNCSEAAQEINVADIQPYKVITFMQR